MEQMRRWALAALVVALVVAQGCQVEHAPNREQRQEKHMEEVAKKGLPPTPPPKIDDAARVVAACGPAAYDRVLAIYDKRDNGPLRRMVYHGRETVTIDFIPSVPLARKVVEEGPLPQRRLQPLLPRGSVWRFDDAWMQKQEYLTADRIGLYLPCAAKALSYEY